METKQFQLPKDFAEKWVAALRQMPEAKHHTGELRNPKDETCYCSIGVGMVANNIPISENGMMILIDGKTVDYYENFIFHDRLAYEIVDMNDMKNRTFSYIADWLIENVEFI